MGADSRGNLNNFSGKMSAQSEMIDSLKAQLEEYRKTNKALTLRRFDDVGSDNIMGNRLIDAWRNTAQSMARGTMSVRDITDG